MAEKRRSTGITHSTHWPNYVGGILTETGFILSLTALALLMAVIAKAIWR
ncbi:MAG: hypothetical protein LLG08_05910 [Actinomycetia bacterium]|nr:hypothetical protein [Actinomycetes bacterium]